MIVLIRRASALALVLPMFVAACGTIRTHRDVEQPLGRELTTGIGGTLFRLDKIGDLPNAFSGRDIWGGKVDKGFAEVRLVAIEGQTLLLDVIDVSRQSSETTMDRYKVFQPRPLVSVEAKQSINIGSSNGPAPYRVSIDTTKQADIVVAGIRMTILEVQPYSVRIALRTYSGNDASRTEAGWSGS